MKTLNIILIAFVLSACAHSREKLLDANWVSMKNDMPPTKQTKLASIGQISEEYCFSSFKGRGSYGLMDEVVKQAEAKHGIDYIKSPSFSKSVGHQCVQVSGQGYRVIR
jgi:hypothetical protein